MPIEIFGIHVRFSSALLFSFKTFSFLVGSHACILRQHLIFSSSKFFLFSSKAIFSLRKLFSRVSHFLLSVHNMIFSSRSYFCLKSFQIHFVLKFRILINPDFNHWYEFCISSNWFSSLHIFNVKFLTSIPAKCKYCFKFLHSNM